VQRRVAAGVLSAGHARALLAVADAGGQERLAQRVVAEGLSVRSIEEMVALGETGEEAPATRRSGHKVPVPEAEEVAARLSDHLDTRVRVDLGRRRGRITIDFASAEDLERIARLIEQK
jgi:ParB family transcriptional regulator, chromosome partitioning protein